MSNWLRIDPSKYSQRDQSTIANGVHLSVLASPYDKPEAIRGYYDDEKARFVIEFRYMNEEPVILRPADDYVTLRLGKNSRRVYAMEVDVNSLSARSVTLALAVRRELESAMAALVKRDPEKKDNYDFASEALDVARGGLLRALVARAPDEHRAVVSR